MDDILSIPLHEPKQSGSKPAEETVHPGVSPTNTESVRIQFELLIRIVFQPVHK